jgi:hypothetical protein
MRVPRVRLTVRTMMIGIMVIAVVLVAAQLLVMWKHDAEAKADDDRWMRSPSTYQEDQFWDEYDRSRSESNNQGKSWWRFGL